MVTGWLSGEDCPDCGGPLLETSATASLLTLECPGCGHRTTWLVDDEPDDTNPADTGESEAE
jgi:uncharacterized Zn finger protein (UPF0148 family)